jgi:hypothetical protein
MSMFHGWHQHPPKEEGRKLLYLPPPQKKLAVGN